MIGHQFREGELHFVIAHEPAAQFRLRGMTSSAQRVQERVTAQAALPQRVRQCGVAGAPCAQQSQPDQRTGHGTIVRGKWRGQRQDVCEGCAVVRHLLRSVLL